MLLLPRSAHDPRAGSTASARASTFSRAGDWTGQRPPRLGALLPPAALETCSPPSAVELDRLLTGTFVHPFTPTLPRRASFLCCRPACARSARRPPAPASIRKDPCRCAAFLGTTPSPPRSLAVHVEVAHYGLAAGRHATATCIHRNERAQRPGAGSQSSRAAAVHLAVARPLLPRAPSVRACAIARLRARTGARRPAHALQLEHCASRDRVGVRPDAEALAVDLDAVGAGALIEPTASLTSLLVRANKPQRLRHVPHAPRPLLDNASDADERASSRSSARPRSSTRTASRHDPPRLCAQRRRHRLPSPARALSAPRRTRCVAPRLLLQGARLVESRARVTPGGKE